MFIYVISGIGLSELGKSNAFFLDDRVRFGSSWLRDGAIFRFNRDTDMAARAAMAWATG
jgi:hypothetical protein